MSGKILSSKKCLNIIHIGSEITGLIAKKEPGIPFFPVLVVEESLFKFDSISETEK